MRHLPNALRRIVFLSLGLLILLNDVYGNHADPQREVKAMTPATELLERLRRGEKFRGSPDALITNGAPDQVALKLFVEALRKDGVLEPESGGGVAFNCHGAGRPRGQRYYDSGVAVGSCDRYGKQGAACHGPTPFFTRCGFPWPTRGIGRGRMAMQPAGRACALDAAGIGKCGAPSFLWWKERRVR